MQEVKSLLDILQQCKIDDTTNIIQDKIYFVIGNAVIGSEGNFVSLSGQAKSGKSNFISAIIAAGISKREIFGINIITDDEKYKIALFDTEQSPYDIKRKTYIIKKLAKVENIYEKFDCYSMVEQSSKNIIRLMITYLQNNPECAVLILDGLLDAIDNMNDEKESKLVIKAIRKLSKKYKCLIITVLHQSKKDKMSIGHIGSASDRYAQSTLEIEKNDGNFIMRPKLLRSAGSFEAIEIFYDEQKKSLNKI